MPVPSTIADLDAVAANNSPSGSEPIGTNLDDYLRSHAAILKQVNNAKADLASPTFTGTVTTANLTASGDVTLSGSGKRILGDFSNATVANRVMFQTSTANSGTDVSALPNGTSTDASLVAWNNSNPTNASRISIYAAAAEVSLRSAISGSGTYLPMTFYTGGSERMRIDASGNIIATVNSTAPTLSTNKTMSFELTSDTQLKIKVRGSDGVTRSTSLTLA